MISDRLIVVVIITGFILSIVILVLILRLISLYSKLENSFSKLGYVIREDAKKFFSDSEEKNLTMQESYSQANKNIVKQAVEEILEEQNKRVSLSYIENQKQSAIILNDAHDKADRIISQAQKDGRETSERIMEKSTYVIENVLNDYAKENLNLEDHEKIINKLLEDFSKNG